MTAPTVGAVRPQAASASRASRACRVVWLWCVAYTALTPRDPRERRRGEIRSHLWESEHAGLSARTIAAGAVLGVGHDLLWAVSRGLPGVVRSFATPTPYVVLAPVFPVQAWIVSALVVGRTAHLAEGVGAAGGGVMLAVAGLVWVVRRGRT